MGYYSEFSGSMTPSKPLPDCVITAINEADRDVRVMLDSDDGCGEVGDIVPWSETMKGYDIDKDLMCVLKLLQEHGIHLVGEIYRTGESGDDYTMYKADEAGLSVLAGEVVYGNPKKITREDITRYAVRVMRENRKTHKKEPFGWLCTSWKNGEHGYSIHGNGVDVPNNNWSHPDTPFFQYKADAIRAARGMKKAGITCKVIGIEDHI